MTLAIAYHFPIDGVNLLNSPICQTAHNQLVFHSPLNGLKELNTPAVDIQQAARGVKTVTVLFTELVCLSLQNGPADLNAPVINHLAAREVKTVDVLTTPFLELYLTTMIRGHGTWIIPAFQLRLT
jgi:hypothetical protein